MEEAAPGVCEIAGGTGKRPSRRHRSPRQSANGRPRCSAWTIVLYGAAEVCRTARIGVPSIAERRRIKRGIEPGPEQTRSAEIEVRAVLHSEADAQNCPTDRNR